MYAEVRRRRPEIPLGDIDPDGPTNVRSNLSENAPVSTTHLEDPVRTSNMVEDVLDLGPKVLTDPR